MPFFLSSSSDYNRIQRTAAGDNVLLLAKKSALVGQGPGCWYDHSWLLWSPSAPADAGDDQLHVAAFGCGPEPRAVETREISVSEAEKMVDGKCSIDLANLPDNRHPLNFTTLRTYRCVAKNGSFRNGPYSVAAWCDAAFVNMLAELDVATV